MGLLDGLFSRRTRRVPESRFKDIAWPEPDKRATAYATPLESEGSDLMIFSEQEKIKVLEDTGFTWRRIYKTEGRLEFRRAFQIVPRNHGAPLKGCRYRIHERDFQDLSFINGRTVQSYPNDYEVRKHPSGNLFLYSREKIPIFDPGDRDWDSRADAAVYYDREGVNLIYCRHGFAIPDISVYVGMTRAFPGFADWLRKLGCADRGSIIFTENAPCGV